MLEGQQCREIVETLELRLKEKGLQFTGDNVFENGSSVSPILFFLTLAWNECFSSATPSVMMFCFAKGWKSTGPNNQEPTNQEPLKLCVKRNIFSVLVDYLRCWYRTGKPANLIIYQRNVILEFSQTLPVLSPPEARTVRILSPTQ